MGVIRTITYTANTIITEEEDKEEKFSHIKKILSLAGYTKWTWQAEGRRKLHCHPHQRDHIRSNIMIAYVGVSQNLSASSSEKLELLHTPSPIRKLLVAPKDIDKPEDKCGVVYHLLCQDCDAHYVRETERALKHHLKEHSRDSSPVGNHMDFHQHKLNTDNIKILDRESRWFQRGVREALQIFSRSPSWNRDRIRHQLFPSTAPLSGLVMYDHYSITWPPSELKKNGGCHLKASHFQSFMFVSDRFKFISSLRIRIDCW